MPNPNLPRDYNFRDAPATLRPVEQIVAEMFAEAREAAKEHALMYGTHEHAPHSGECIMKPMGLLVVDG